MIKYSKSHEPLSITNAPQRFLDGKLLPEISSLILSFLNQKDASALSAVDRGNYHFLSDSLVWKHFSISKSNFDLCKIGWTLKLPRFRQLKDLSIEMALMRRINSTSLRPDQVELVVEGLSNVIALESLKLQITFQRDAAWFSPIITKVASSLSSLSLNYDVSYVRELKLSNLTTLQAQCYKKGSLDWLPLTFPNISSIWLGRSATATSTNGSLAFLSQWSGLRTLALSCFDELINEGLQKCSLLTELSLFNCWDQPTASVDLFSPPLTLDLRILRLNCQEIEFSEGSFPNLEHLYFGSATEGSTFASVRGQFTSLRRLQLKNLHSSVKLEHLKNLPTSVIELSLHFGPRDRKIQDILDLFSVQFPALKILKLHWTSRDEPMTPRLSFPQLQRLNLDNFSETPQVPPHVRVIHKRQREPKFGDEPKSEAKFIDEPKSETKSKVAKPAAGSGEVSNEPIVSLGPAKPSGLKSDYIWQYEDDGWKNYEVNASNEVEDVYQFYLANRGYSDVRAVKSGQWEYMVDFMAMKQTNIQRDNHTIRNVRRVKTVSA
eukprot:TRINITY_DN2737_c0_g1_i2.p1 TRINITY_DN2737_c0_g1~~TRINITY_DN2737_c0_g1_i2.p1  ORF type:complete len:549 (+),score=67.80 TRINITY_DN2737_c0_g1_i2:108-1754(+)